MISKDLTKNIDIKLDKTSDSKFISFSLLKTAISENDFSKMSELYTLVLDIDLNIAGSIEQRKNALLENEFIIQSEDKKFLEFFEKLEEYFDLENFCEHLSSAVYFGISLQDISYDIKDGFILPLSSKEIPYNLLAKDEEKKDFYLEDKENNKLYLDSFNPLKLTRFFYKYNKDAFINNSLSAKLLYYSVLKHSVITLNLEYLDKNAIPPIIVKTDDISNEELAGELMTQLQMLKSNAFGIFNKEIEIDTLKQDSESKFLELLEYCDKKQNELILGGNLTGSSEKVGSQALGNVHQNRLTEIIKSDAKKISKFVNEYLKDLCTLNFKDIPKFIFKINVPDNEDAEVLKVKSETIKNLTSAGYEIPTDHIEKEFKIKGVKFKQLESKQDNHILEINSQANKKPLDIVDAALESKDAKNTFKSNEKDIENILNEVLKDANSFEEAYENIILKYDDISIDDFERSLCKYLASSELIGHIDE